MPVENQSVIQQLYDAGIVLPKTTMKARELWYYRTNGIFQDNLLEHYRQICPTLFEPGHNVVCDAKYFYLNMRMYDKLVDWHPKISFQTYEDIEKFCSTPTFYLIKNKEKIEGCDVMGNEYQDCSLLFLLICPQITEKYQIYSQEELIGSFLNNYDFIDPCSETNRRFTRFQIKRLLRLLFEIHKENTFAAIFVDVIDTVQAGTVKRMKFIEEMKEFVKNNPEISREFFNKILELSMRMRGWSGKGNYPLLYEHTVERVDETVLMEELVEFSRHFSGKYAKLCDLSLFSYKEDQFNLSTNEEIGHTIADKIEIILRNNSVHACIRMGSNWLATTAWYYLHEYFGETPFDINQLREII